MSQTNVKSFSDKSNQGASIGFVVYYPFHYYVYKNIYQELRENAEFIIDACHPFPPEEQQRLVSDIVALLESEKVRYRILRREDYYFPVYLENFFAKYQALVSVWEKGCMLLRVTEGLKKINATYGAGKELTMVRPSKSIFDLILAYGSRDSKLFSYYTRAEIVGNPKFDEWFSGSLDKKSILELRELLDAHKKTVLYLPTHSDLSSIDELAEEFAALSSSYNVLVKTHYYTTREEPERLQALKSTGAVIFDDNADLLALLTASDIVVSDNSSAIFDAILADKPVVVADFWDPDFLDLEHKEVRRYTRGTQGALTYSDSIEQAIKREGKVLTLKTASDLKTKVQEGLEDAPNFKKARKELREELFAFNDGKCAKRAADAIRRCLADKSPRNRPILYHAIEAYKRRINVLSYQREKFLNQKIAYYKQELSKKILEEDQGILFTIILLDAGGEKEHDLAYRALTEQEFPKERFEILLNKGPQKLQETIKKARGRIVCFATPDCIVPSDWLYWLYLAYRRHPDAGGVGGYVGAAKQYYREFDEYYYYRLARCFDLHRENSFLTKLYEVKNNLFYQNPAGDLRSMSYVRDLIPSLPPFENLIQLEHILREYVIRQAPLVFIPRAVVRYSRITRQEFGSDIRERAFLHSGRYGYSGVSESMREILWAARMRNTKLMGVVMLAILARCLGSMQSQLWKTHVAVTQEPLASQDNISHSHRSERKSASIED